MEFNLADLFESVVERHPSSSRQSLLTTVDSLTLSSTVGQTVWRTISPA